MAAAISLTLNLPSVSPAAGSGTPDEWYAAGQQAVEDAERLKKPASIAKNVILFVGDGMGISTVTAARILEGQLRGENAGEDVGIYATGPNSHLFHGVMEQNVVFHVMNDALKLKK